MNEIESSNDAIGSHSEMGQSGHCPRISTFLLDSIKRVIDSPHDVFISNKNQLLIYTEVSFLCQCPRSQVHITTDKQITQNNKHPTMGLVGAKSNYMHTLRKST